MTIAWRKWKLGALVALAMALFVALAGVAAGMHWQAFLSVLGAACATHFGAFLTTHPVDEVAFDDKPKSSPSSPSPS